MTEEELRKEATEYALEWGDKTNGTYACCRDGYLVGAEPREKRIAELEKENTELRIKTVALENANKAMSKELDDMTSGGISVLKNVVRSKEQLTKAKIIIKDYMIIVTGDHTTVCSVPEENRCINVLKLNEQAEQFLSEVEK